MNGVFGLNKPVGPTTAELLNQLKSLLLASSKFPQVGKNKRRGSKSIKVGHGGTLDPLASGVVVVGIGSGTKELSKYLNDCHKTYRVVALFGSATTTFDSQGAVLKFSSTSHLSNDLIKAKMELFTGDFMQTAPAFSALKINGKPLYEYARKGQTLPRPIEPRKVHAEVIQLGMLNHDHCFKHPEQEASTLERQFAESNHVFGPESQATAINDITDEKNPILEFTAKVSSGTYIRSIVHELGLSLGTTAHMVKLERLQQADWRLNHNVLDLEDFKKPEAEWKPLLANILEQGPRYCLNSKHEHDDTDSPDEDVKRVRTSSSVNPS